MRDAGLLYILPQFLHAKLSSSASTGKKTEIEITNVTHEILYKNTHADILTILPSRKKLRMINI